MEKLKIAKDVALKVVTSRWTVLAGGIILGYFGGKLITQVKASNAFIDFLSDAAVELTKISKEEHHHEAED